MFIPPYPCVPKYASKDTGKWLDRQLAIIKWVSIAFAALFLVSLIVILSTK